MEVERLEDRSLAANGITAHLAGHVLFVHGTKGAVPITVEVGLPVAGHPHAKRQVIVVGAGAFPRSQIDQIDIFGAASETVVVAKGNVFPIPFTITRSLN